jgi:two-component system CheB/CheR fusion protein
VASRHRKPGIVVIGIGASAGGVTALKELLPNLPMGSGFAYVVALHTGPTHRSLLADILEKESALLVKMAVDGERPQPDKIYVMPSDHDCTIQDGKLRLLDPVEQTGPRHSIDIMFASLSESYGERSAGIVLSGTGSDGLHGMLAIKAAGGIAIAQDPETAAYSGMPRSVIDAGLADLVLPPARIGGELVEIMRHPRRAEVHDAFAQSKESLGALLAVLSRKTRCDFGQYKENTLSRRVERRMAVHKLDNLKDYSALVEKSDTEADLLFKDLLISVTGFFRDQEAFKVLGEAVQDIVERKSRGEVIRIWVPGCATGEEAFSIAILLAEALGKGSLGTPIQVFASDVDTGAIAFARRGLYLETSIKTVPKPLFEKYFTRIGNVYQVVKNVRDMVVFARHDLMQDPPFINLDLVSCRNVLIYFKRRLQERLIPVFHYSLNPGGYLVLGKSENVGKCTNLFKPFAERSKVFVKIGEGETLPAILQQQHVAHERVGIPQTQPKGTTSLKDLYRTLVADAYAPPGVFVNDRFEVVHVQGDVSRFVHLPPGDLNVNVIDMAIAPLRLETRLVLQKAQRERVVVRGHPVELRDERGISRITPIAIPPTVVPEGGGHTLLLLEERTAAEPAEPVGRSKEDRDGIRIRDLEQELVATREQLQTSFEELQTSNEDLQSVKEEYQSTAEELQSANEELQTSNEELQSTNEELLTVNEELKIKSEALEIANADLENILNTVLSGIVVLDRNFRVTHYSIASRQVFDLLPSSVGRPLVAIGSPFDLTVLSGEIEKVMESGCQLDHDMALGDKMYFVRLIPLYEEGNTFSGMVITFNDETERKQAEKDTRRLATVVRDSNDAIAVLDLDGRFLTWNDAAKRTYGYTEAEARELTLRDLLPEGQQAQALQLIERLTGGENVSPCQAKRRTKDGRELDVWLTATLLRDEDGKPQAVATTERDLADIKKLAAEKEFLNQADRNKSEFLARISHELRTPLNTIIGFSEIIKDELLGSVEQRKYVQYGKDIHSSSLHLLDLINDILDLSKIEANAFELEEEVLDPRVLAEEVLHMLAPQADEQGVSLSIDATADLPNLKSDRRAIRQILLNLLNNAIKFTPSGGRVVLGMHLDQDGSLSLVVCDTGVGIAEEDIPKSMKPFTQIPSRFGTKNAGTGLGLSIVRGLAELLGTEFDIASKLRTGTTVTIRFGEERLVW